MSIADHLPGFGSAEKPAPRRYQPAVGPRLRALMVCVFVLTAVLGVNSCYLAGVTLLEWISHQRGDDYSYQNYFYLWMMLGHLGLGLLLCVPFAVFVAIHVLTARRRRNRRAIQVGYGLLAACLVLLLTGVLLTGVDRYELKQPSLRRLVYWLHIVAPIVILWMYLLHRLAGPRIRWRAGLLYLALMAAVSGAMVYPHALDPRDWNTVGPAEGNLYFRPSLAQTASEKFISAEVLQMDQYCLKCHADAYDGWYHSAHHFSSFNNPMYLASVRETRDVALKRDKSVRASRWCAGCHDPVPLFSGAFDEPDFDDVRHPTAHAGITCTVCHSITHVNSPRGNADYTIEEPLHYPFAASQQPILQWINNLLVKSKPAMHRRTFLKPLHQTSEFCSTCHKVHLPEELTHYRDFLRGQNHYDSWLLSGASGHGTRSNYYGMWASVNCASCHMPARESADFAARFIRDPTRPDLNHLSIHSHLFPGANTALPFLQDKPDIVALHQQFLQKAARVDLVNIREEESPEPLANLPLRPNLPSLKPGQTYILETTVRNLGVGHHLTQGTADSNELWLEVRVSSGDELIAHSGRIDADGHVDRDAHFVNAWVLDRDGRRINRRNPQDIFTVLYNHQVPPGSAQLVRHRLELPDELPGLVSVEVSLRYRKFDQTYMDFVTRSARPGDLPIRGHAAGQPYRNQLPITTMASDKVIFPVEGSGLKPPAQEFPIARDHIYMRRNDYGLALLAQGNGIEAMGNRSADVTQAEKLFTELRRLTGYIDVQMHQARVLLMEGRLTDAVAAIERPSEAIKPLFFYAPVYAPWALNWVNGVLNRKLGNAEAAIRNFRLILSQRTESMQERGFDFQPDYVLHNELGQVLFEQARRSTDPQQQQTLLEEAVREFEVTLSLDPENATAHYNLGLLFRRLGDSERARRHHTEHQRYRPDDVAWSVRQQKARQADPAANRAAEGIVIYPLKRIPLASDREADSSQNFPETVQ